jgi:hypothetical protein
MNWKFTLIDSSSVSTVVEPPVGWNGIGGNLTRNIIHHGININISTDSFEWVGEAYDLLYAEYLTNGANGQYQVQIDYECAEGDGYTNYFIGAFDFNTFERQCSDYCFIKISVTASKCTDVFMSRMGQDVDIEAVTNFDGEAITPPLLRVLNIEGQDILLQDKADNTGQTHSGFFNTVSTGNKFIDIPVYLPNNVINEFYLFNINNVSANYVAKAGGDDNLAFPMDLIDWVNHGQFLYITDFDKNDVENCVNGNEFVVNWHAKGTFSLTPTYNGNYSVILRVNKRNPFTGSLTDLGTVTIASGITLTNGVPASFTFDEGLTGSTVILNDNEYLFFYFHITIFKSTGGGIGVNDPTDFQITYENDTYFEQKIGSACDPTVATSVYLPELLKFLPTAYMDTECPSVVMESELNQCLDFYQITKGSFIRQVTEPSVPKLFVSYEYLFDQCRKIFNIGWGFDNNETELKIARIEHFYKSTIVVDVGLVDKAIFTTAKDLIYGTINVGYNKWEAEEYNGLDEMNTERQYRRNIDSNPSELDLMADIISAGYTIEVTRRKNQGRTGTSDWRYDDDLFIVNANVVEGNLYAYRGIDANPDNVYSPNTRMNYALTPARSLMRWFKSIAAAQPTVTNEQLIFTSGTGNYIAQGQMTTYCPVEGSTLSEKETIDVSNFDNDYYITPIWKTEYVTFTAPFSMANFEDVKVNPYGAIRFRCSDTYYTGNIVEINHDPNEGLAEFKLLIRR